MKWMDTFINLYCVSQVLSVFYMQNCLLAKVCWNEQNVDDFRPESFFPSYWISQEIKLF